MSLLFIGSEPEDFPITGGGSSFGTNSSLYRTAYSRASLQTGAGLWPSAGYFGTTFTPQTSFWVTGRFGSTTTFTAGNIFFILGNTSGGTPAANARLRLKVSSASPSTIVLETWDGSSTATTLVTSTATIAGSTSYKLDIAIDSYGASGRVRVYIDQVLFIDTGAGVNIASGGSTSLNVVYLTTLRTIVDTPWSECIVADEDTRPLSVKTLVPNAAGDTTAWTSGAYTDIDDVAASDLDNAVSETALQILTVNCTGMPTGFGGNTVRALKAVAYCARGASGPSKLALGLRQSSTNAFVTGQSLDTGYTAISTTWTTNPITLAAFTTAEIEAIQLAYRSET